MFIKRLFLMSLAAALLAPAALAQEANTRVGVCNPARVFERMDERRAIQERINGRRVQIQAEAERRQGEIRQLEQQRQNLRPDTPQFNQLTQEILEKSVQYNVWGQLQQAELARTEREHLRRLFDKIQQATGEIASSRGMSLVLSENRPEITEEMNPDQVRAVLGTRNVLYVSEQADLTEAVIALVNRRYLETGEGAVGGAGN